MVKKSSLSRLVCLALLLFVCLPVQADDEVDGQETRNGGSGVRTNNGTFHLADLYFQREGEGVVNLGQEISSKVEELLRWTRDNLRLNTLNPLHQALFGPLSEYVFVKSLPAECSFLDDTEVNDPDSSLEHIGCSIGYLTYIIPEKFLQLSIDDQVLFLIHERLHGISRSATYDIKTDIIKALAVYLKKIYPARTLAYNVPNLPIVDILTDEDVAILKKLPTRILQLVFNPNVAQPKPPTLMFFKTGALIYLVGDHKLTKFSCVDCRLNVNTRIEIDFKLSHQAGYEKRIPELVIDLKNAEIRNSTFAILPPNDFILSGESFTLVESNISGNVSFFKVYKSHFNFSNSRIVNSNLNVSWNLGVDLVREDIDAFFDAELSFDGFDYQSSLHPAFQVIDTNRFKDEIVLTRLPATPQGIQRYKALIKVKPSMVRLAARN